MKIYIDSEFKCHTTNPDGKFREFDLPFFDGRCKTYVEGHIYVPPEETWIRSDGVVFNVEMVTTWKPYKELDAAQREYEKQLLAEYEAALAEIEKALGV